MGENPVNLAGISPPVSTEPQAPKKSRWSYRAGAVDRWMGEAGTQFVNGFIAGWKHGVGTGATTGILTGGTDIAASLTAWQQILVSGGATLSAMFMSGFSQVSDWHATNKFPNPWGKYDPNAPDTKAPFAQ